MPAQLTILGGGGWFPAYGRHTACALLRRDGHAVVIDAGTGISRLSERPELLDGVGRLDIVLTHFHLDHIGGLAYLAALGFDGEITLWGPGQVLYDAPTSGFLDRLLGEPFHPVPLAALDIEVCDLPAGELELEGTRLTHRRQERHSIATLGLRFGDTLAWITDTALDPESAPFAAGCHTLAHEAWFPSPEPRNPEVHSSGAEAAQVAAAAGTEQLLLTHLPPFASDLEPLLQDAAGAGRPDATLALDWLRLTPTG